MAGILYVIGLPIGNVKDISMRALETLKGVDVILCEDTRTTRKLLAHFSITTSLISYRDQNHTRIYPRILKLLNEDKNLGIVSDAGTPLISDPGYKLIRNLHNEGIRIVPIPGPSAITASLSVAGLPTDKFIYLGFLPKSKGKRQRILEQYALLELTLVLYESPYRMHALLELILDTLGDRLVCLAKDLTKSYEDVIVDRVSNLVQNIKEFKGEYTVLIGKDSI